MNYSVITSFEHILREIKIGGRYRLETTNSIEGEIQSLSALFSITPRQVLLLTAVMDLCGFGSVECSKLATALECNFFSFLSMKQDLDALKNRELIEGVHTLSIPSDLIDSIVENRAFTISNISNMSTKRILEKLSLLYNAVLEKRKSPLALLRAMDMMILNNQSTSIAMACDRYGTLCYDSTPEGPSDEDVYTCSMNRDERMLFYCLLANMYTNVSWYDLSPFFDSKKIKVLQGLCRANGLQLQSEGVIDYIIDESSDEYLLLRDRVKEQILSDVGGVVKKQYFPEVIYHNSILPRNLFYTDSIKERIKELSLLLSNERFRKVRDSLAEHGLRTGFTVLFYGAPGTGKTETALQIARYTSRDVISVNVADLKDAYVGETEKNVKNVFDKYRLYVSESGSFPILLFNEADAILGERMKNPRGAADRTENSMQNIILEEMEKLDGIMIATTNLSVNLDKAFDRRFLYRICFTSPDTSSMADILSSMIPELTASEAETIAKEFSLSGGQIENVCRRKTILSAIMNRPATFDEIKRLCLEESSTESPMPKIGF